MSLPCLTRLCRSHLRPWSFSCGSIPIIELKSLLDFATQWSLAANGTVFGSVEIAVLMPSLRSASGRRAPRAPARAVAPLFPRSPSSPHTRAQVCFGGTVEPSPFQGKRARLLLPRKTRLHEHRKTRRFDESCPLP